jgi:hypothetical protein
MIGPPYPKQVFNRSQCFLSHITGEVKREPGAPIPDPELRESLMGN